MPAYLTRINHLHCIVCAFDATQELHGGFNDLRNVYCDLHAERALIALLEQEASMFAGPLVHACQRCGGPAHAAKRTVITSPEDDLYNDRIEHECEGRILRRMAPQ